MHWRFTDTDDEYGLTLANGVLTHRRGAPAAAVDAIVGVERVAINEVVTGAATLEAVAGAGRLTIDGDQTKLGGLLSLLERPDPKFAIVTP